MKFSKIAKVMKAQKKSMIEIEAHSNRDKKSRIIFSETYVTRIKDFLLEKEVDLNRITVKPKGKGKDKIRITVSKVSAK